ncbi:MAG: hypothetical protein QXH67_00565 [Candidatus Bathyarchaeia archaeon]
MRKIGYLLLSTIIILATIGAALTTLPVEAPDGQREYAVGGEIIPVNPTPYLLNPILLAAVAIIAVILLASLTVESFPIRIEITRQ